MDTAIRRQTLADLLHRTARRLPGTTRVVGWVMACYPHEFDAPA